MKKYLASFFIVLCGLVSVSFQVSAQLNGFNKPDAIINKDSNNALNITRLQDNPIREGMHDMTDNPVEGSVEEIINKDKIETHGGAVEALMKLIQIIINRSLGILGLVALIYLIYNGFLMTTAGEGKQFDKGKSGIKTAVIALAGIGLSWFIISMILRIITKLTS